MPQRKPKPIPVPESIRKNLGISKYRMAKLMNMPSVQHWIAFTNSTTTISPRNFIRLWRVSGLRADHYLALWADYADPL